MVDGAGFVLKGCGRIEPAWMRRCLRLFRERGVNIRKLFWLNDADPDGLSVLEIQFVMEAREQATFVPMLTACLAEQVWTEQSLLPL